MMHPFTTMSNIDRILRMDEQLKTKVENYINKSWLGYQKFAKIQEKPIPHFEIKIMGNTSKEISNKLYPFNA